MDRIILVPIDYSDVTDTLLQEARRLAKALDAKLHLVHVATIDAVIYSPYEGGMGLASARKTRYQVLQEAGDHLGEIAETCRAEAPGVATSLIEGSAGPGIMEEARRLRPMMIVLGSHGHGALYHLLAGSVCEYVMKHAVCPVVIVPSCAGTYDVDVRTAHAATTA